LEDEAQAAIEDRMEPGEAPQEPAAVDDREGIEAGTGRLAEPEPDTGAPGDEPGQAGDMEPSAGEAEAGQAEAEELHEVGSEPQVAEAAAEAGGSEMMPAAVPSVSDAAEAALAVVAPEATVPEIAPEAAAPAAEPEPPAVEAAIPEGEAAPRLEPDDGRQWYVVHCYSGYENKVRHNLEQRIETMNMKDKIFDVVVPTEEEMEVKDGKRRTVERRVFPGYILVQMLMDEDSWYVVRNTPGVTGFVGMGNEPTPLRPEEVAQIVKRMEAEAPRIKVTYKTGQKVRIIDGPFNDFIGTVDNIDMDKAKVRVMVSFFGRETPVELDFLQVEKA
jgi:transcriptional antiterminator NusG